MENNNTNKNHDLFVNKLLNLTKEKKIEWTQIRLENISLINTNNNKIARDSNTPIYKLERGYSTTLDNFDICLVEEYANEIDDYARGIYIILNNIIIKSFFGGQLIDKTLIERLLRLVDRDGLDENEVIENLIKFIDKL